LYRIGATSLEKVGSAAAAGMAHMALQVSSAAPADVANIRRTFIRISFPLAEVANFG
jgi:hypothetical protein